MSARGRGADRSAAALDETATRCVGRPKSPPAPRGGGRCGHRPSRSHARDRQPTCGRGLPGPTPGRAGTPPSRARRRPRQTMPRRSVRRQAPGGAQAQSALCACSAISTRVAPTCPGAPTPLWSFPTRGDCIPERADRNPAPSAWARTLRVRCASERLWGSPCRPERPSPCEPCRLRRHRT